MNGSFADMMNKDLMNRQSIYIDTYTHAYSKLHKHDFLELAYIVDGTAIHTRDGIQTAVSVGDYFIIDYNSYHMYESEKTITLINCLFLPEFIDNTLAGCNSLAAVLNNYLIRFDCGIRECVSSVFHDESGEVRHMIDKLMKEFTEKRPGYPELMRCTLIEIIITMMRQIAVPSVRSGYKSHSRYLIDYIDKNYSREISLSAIAEQLHYSVSHLSHTFSEDTGMGFNEYLQKTRLEHACRLLANTDKKIFEIAETVGIFDTNYFRELFKRNFGISPAVFRKNNKTDRNLKK